MILRLKMNINNMIQESFVYDKERKNNTQERSKDSKRKNYLLYCYILAIVYNVFLWRITLIYCHTFVLSMFLSELLLLLPF